jgi:hypothetical protein
MRNTAAFIGQKLCGANIEAAIDLHGIEIDNFCADR